MKLIKKLRFLLLAALMLALLPLAFSGLAPEKAVFGSNTHSFADEAALYAQWAWYQTSANRIKKLGESGSAGYWWECSPYSGYGNTFCCVYSRGGANFNYADGTYGLAPFGCI